MSVNPSFLNKRGWKQNNHAFYHSNSVDSKGNEIGHSFSGAVELQTEWDCIDKYGKYYFVQRRYNGLSWVVKFTTDKTDYWHSKGQLVPKFEDITDQSSAISVANELNKGVSVDAIDLPEDACNLYKILVCKEKHDIRYFFIGSLNDAKNAAYKLFLERDEYGYYHYETEDDVEKPSLSEEDVNKLPAGSVKDFALKEWEQYKKEIKYRKSDQYEIELYKKCLTGDKTAALNLMLMRENHEYEGFEFVTPESI